MAVKSKTQIITDIDKKIITNGDIKAVDTNAILKDILDCKELNAIASSEISTFSFQSATALVDNKGARLNYSMRGVTNSFVNVTFNISILENNVNSLTFIHGDSKIAEILKNIMEPKLGFQIDFLVKVKSKQSTSKIFKIACLNFSYSEKEFFITLDSPPNDNLLSGDQIFTSFAIHCPNDFK